MQQLFCNHCKNQITQTTIFCGNCGKKITFQKDIKEESSLKLVIAFYISFLIFTIVSYVVSLDQFNLVTEIVIESIFILITLGFTFFDYKKIIGLYNFKKVNWKNLLFSLLFPVFSAFTVYYAVEWFDSVFLEGGENVFLTYSEFPNSLFWVVIFYVIIPPIFEELAFRGFLFNQLLQISNWKVTVFATALIFALIHFSFLSLLWIFPFGIILGYLRYKYETLILGMVIHLIHNLIVVLLDYYYLERVLEF